MTQITEAQKFRISQDGGYPVIRTGAVDASPDSDLIAHVWNSDYLPLIAAAPDLLANLKVVIDIISDARADEDVDCSTSAGGYLLGDVMNDAFYAATAAIAKATGGAA